MIRRRVHGVYGSPRTPVDSPRSSRSLERERGLQIPGQDNGFTRCPGCGCIDWPPQWIPVHRRTCEFAGTQAKDWGK